MTRIHCPYCEFHFTSGEGNAAVTYATEQVIGHVRKEHPHRKVVSPRPGVVEDEQVESLKLGLQYGLGVNVLRRDLPEAPSNKLQSLMLTVSVREDNRAVAYNLLGVTGHDLLMAGYDFSISANEYDPEEPLPPLPEDLRYDEGTMFKVREAIMNSLMDTDLVEAPSRSTDAIVNALLNAGILFRERP